MRLRTWDPATAAEAELEAWLRAYNAALAADLPERSPSGARRCCGITSPSRCLGRADSPGWPRTTTAPCLGPGASWWSTAWVYSSCMWCPRRASAVLAVSYWPRWRRRAVAEGFTDLGVEVIGGTPAAAFFHRHGFRHAYTEMRGILQLDSVDWPHIEEMANGVAHGYRIEYFPGDLPDEILLGYAAAKQVRREAPTGDLDLRPSSYDADRLRASLRCLNARGLRPYIVVAVHERSEKVAGLTELVVPAQHPTRADQYDTIIVPEHNGYGLARAIKARMLLELRAAEPQLRDVQTWHATDREQLQAVNSELGFRPDREWREYEVDAVELAARLDAAAHQTTAG